MHLGDEVAPLAERAPELLALRAREAEREADYGNAVGAQRKLGSLHSLLVNTQPGQYFLGRRTGLTPSPSYWALLRSSNTRFLTAI